MMVLVRVWNVRGHERSSKSISAPMLQCNISARPARRRARAEATGRGDRPDFAHAPSALRSLATRSDPRTCNMSEQRPRVVAVGEALIEFVRGGGGRFGIGWARGTLHRAG